MNVKKMVMYGIIVAVVITGSNIITGCVTGKRANDAYNKLEAGLTAIELSNRELREANTLLINNNRQLRIEQQRTAELITEGQGIIRDFQSGIGDSYSTIERIEEGLGALERLIAVLFEET